MASSALLHREENVAGAPLPSEGDAVSRAAADPEALGVARSSKETLRLKLYAALIVIDALGLFLGFAAANFFWLGDAFSRHGMDMFVMALPLYLAIAANSRAYSIAALKAPRVSIQRAARSLLMAIAVVIGTIFYLKVSNDFSRMVMGAGTAGAIAALCAFRYLFGGYVGARYSWRFTNELLFVDEIAIIPTHGQIVVFADKEELSPSTDNPQLLDRIGRLLKNCDRVVLACPPQRRAAWAAMMKGVDVSIEVLAPELDDMGALGMDRYNEQSTIIVSSGPLGLRDRMLKRAFDLGLTVPFFILLLPLMGLIALAIKMDSPGPVFFRQPRVGLGNRTFRMLKFRSMRFEASDSDGATSTRRNDERVTSLGRFLRKTSLDELPQLINVLLGDMSIVGPRPHALASTAEDQLFWNIEERYWDRHAVKPGITGLAQVRGFRGATFKQSDLSDRLQADLEYLTGWSIWRDIAIVAATLRVLSHRNAF